jgi:hypothetical protein
MGCCGWLIVFIKLVAGAAMLFVVATDANTAWAQGLELRLIAKDGVPFKWAEGKEEYLGQLPFMTAPDFGKAVAVDARNPNQPGKFNVEISHTAIGRAKYRAVANADRDREFCVVFEALIRQCESFPPRIKGLYEKRTIIFGGFARKEAEDLARRINRTLK